MKNSNLFILSISFLLVFSNSYSQTKEETIEWLNSNLEEYGDKEFMGTYEIVLKNDKDYGEHLVFIKKTWNHFLEKFTYEQFLFLPKVITSIETSSKGRTNNKLDIYIKSVSKSIYTDDESFVSEIKIFMKNGNNDMAKRINKGLLYLMKIMGNEIEQKKELFKN